MRQGCGGKGAAVSHLRLLQMAMCIPALSSPMASHRLHDGAGRLPVGRHERCPSGCRVIESHVLFKNVIGMALRGSRLHPQAALRGPRALALGDQPGRRITQTRSLQVPAWVGSMPCVASRVAIVSPAKPPPVGDEVAVVSG